MANLTITRLIVKGFYRFGRFYKQLTSPMAYIARKFIRCSGEIIDIEDKHGWCLDIGAGIAPYEKEICKSFGIECYLPIDVSVSDRTKVIADGTCLPFRTGSARLVASFDVIQHIPYPEDMFSEISRVLTPGGYLILTFPFLYPECDMHDFHRWTMEGMEQELRRKGLVPILMERRGGACYASAYRLIWILQHIIPGQRRNWRSARSLVGFTREALVMVLILPAQLIAWIALAVDRILVTEGMYMGGAILAQKTDSADSWDECA